MRWVTVVAVVLALAVPVVPAPRPVANVTVGCDGQQVPPPPAADEEREGPTLAPLPWPADPIGGPRMGACDEIGPLGAPELSAE
ncbi:MAG: D-alanyl-D-alanine carboxypeptidase family protein, partial [Pseudonocardia sp.]